MLSVWWDFEGIVYFELFARNQTINSNVYCRQLMKLDKEIKKRCPGVTTRKGVIFHQDNAKPFEWKNIRFKWDCQKWVDSVFCLWEPNFLRKRNYEADWKMAKVHRTKWLIHNWIMFFICINKLAFVDLTCFV